MLRYWKHNISGELPIMQVFKLQHSMLGLILILTVNLTGLRSAHRLESPQPFLVFYGARSLWRNTLLSLDTGERPWSCLTMIWQTLLIPLRSRWGWGAGGKERVRTGINMQNEKRLF